MASAFLKAILKSEGPQGHCVVDMWVLFCLHANQDTTKKVVNIFRRKVSAGHFTEALMVDAMHGRGRALHSLFHGLLGLADNLVRTGAQASQNFGASLYRVMFQEFFELYHQQEVVGALLTHSGAGSERERDCALATLAALAGPGGRGGLRPFSAFIRGLLDYMEGFTLDQVRTVFRILCSMAAPGPNPSGDEGGPGRGVMSGRGSPRSSLAAVGGDLDDVHIFVRKHLAQSQMSLKRIGTIGAVVFVEFQGRAHNKPNRSSSGDGSQSMLSQEPTATTSAASLGVAEAQRTLTMLLTHCQGSPDATAFLYDELARAAGAGVLSEGVLEVLIDLLSDPLQNEFMEDLEAAGAGTQQGNDERALCGGSVTAKPFGGLDQEGVGLAVSLLPMLASEDQETKLKVASLCPLFALLASCHQACSASSMEEIDGVLGMPIMLADSHTIDNITLLGDSEKEAVIGAHFAAVNWVRELANAYVMEKEADSKAKMVKRLSDLCRLERDLLFMLKRCPLIRCPPLSPQVLNWPAGSGSTNEVGGTLGGRTVDGGKGRGSGKGKGKGKAKTKGTGGELKDIARGELRSNMRPLSAEVVLVLGFPGMWVKTRDSQVRTAAVEVRVELHVVRMLLEEMRTHLQRGLKPSEGKGAALARLRNAKVGRGGPSGAARPATVRPVRPALELLGLYQKGGVFTALWSLLQMVGNSLRGVEESVGVICSSLDDEDMLLPCLETTLKVISLLCGSDEVLNSGSGQSLLREALEDLVGGPAESQNGSEDNGNDAFQLAFELLVDFAATMQQLPLVIELVRVLESIASARLKFLAAEAAHLAGGRHDQTTELTQGDSSEPTLHQKLSSLCLTLMQRDWGNGDPKFVYKSSTLGVLVRTHLRWAKDPLEAIEVMSTEVLPLLLETGASLGPTEAYPTLTAASFTHFFTPLLQSLVSCWRDGTDFSGKWVPREALLMRTERMVLIFSLLVQFTKGNPSLSRRVVLVTVLREGKKFVQSFLRAVSFLEGAFQDHQAQVISTFKSLQGATRHIQTLCAYGKELGDASMSKEAPLVKKLLEEFIYRVRSLAEANDCLGALTVGNLQNRGLDGELLRRDDSDEDSSSSEEGSEEDAGEDEGESGEEEGGGDADGDEDN
ncbi:unnamed protein product [Discosporangium mesarthrocarpum]